MQRIRETPSRMSLVCGAIALLTVTNAAADRELDETQSLLGRLARVASLYRDKALRFTCHETIEWSGVGVKGGRLRFNYTFVVDADERLQDLRTSRGDGQEAVTAGAVEAIDPERLGVPRYVSNAYLWLFVFLEERQPLHHYTILGSDDVSGRDAIMIRFEPVKPYREGLNEWFGTAWVDRESSQLLRVEARQVHDETLLRRAERQRDGELDPPRGFVIVETVVTEFGVEKNGMRFPDLVEMQVSDVWVRGRKRRHLEQQRRMTVTQKYADYEFFSVQTAEQVEATVSGAQSGSRD